MRGDRLPSSASYVPLETDRGAAASSKPKVTYCTVNMAVQYRKLLVQSYLLCINVLQFCSFLSLMITFNALTSSQGGRGHWNLNYNNTQSFITTLSYLLASKLWVLLLNLN